MEQLACFVLWIENKNKMNSRFFNNLEEAQRWIEAEALTDYCIYGAFPLLEKGDI